MKMAPTSENTKEMERWAKILRAAVPQHVDLSVGAWDARMAPGFALWSGMGVDEGYFSRCTSDQKMWRACAGLRESACGVDALVRCISASDGALVERGGVDAIEVWTDCELAGLHALWRGWVESGDAPLGERVVRSCERLIEEVQPDNATNRPWAVGAFVWLGMVEDNQEAELYAQTLLHNYQASSARDDALCAAILLDSADGLGAIAERSG